MYNLQETLLPWTWKASKIWLVSLSQQQLKTDPSKATREAMTCRWSHSPPDRSLVLPGHAEQTASQPHPLPWIWLLFTGIGKGSRVKNHRVSFPAFGAKGTALKSRKLNLVPGVEVSMENKLWSLISVHPWMAQHPSLLLSIPDQAASQKVPWAPLGDPLAAEVSLGRIISVPIPALWPTQDKGKKVAV